MRKLVIDRARWYRGHGGFDSALLRPDGRMCCLGFLALECGLSEPEIKEGSEFRDLISHLEKDPEDVVLTAPEGWDLPVGLVDFEQYGDRIVSEVHDRIVGVNDSEEIEEFGREAELRALFRSVGVEVEFTG